MIVGPQKGLFFVATALMCSASLYAAELTAPSGNPLARIFTGEPNRRSLKATIGSGVHPVRLSTITGEAALRKLDAEGRSADP